MGRENWQGGSENTTNTVMMPDRANKQKVMFVCLLRAVCLSRNGADAPGF